MSYYGGTITVGGRDLITTLLAGETIELTRIVVGSGEMPEDTEPIDMTDLVTPVAEATSTVPVVENNVLSMVVEYRNDMNGGLTEGFWLREFGIYAKTANTEETLLYYATLGDSPQPVSAYDGNRIDIRRYPVTIALALDANVQVSYNPGAFITAEEANELIAAAVDAAVQEIVDSGALSTATQVEIVIPAEGWTDSVDTGEGSETDETEETTEDLSGAYSLHVDIAVEGVTESTIPILTVYPAYTETAKACEMCTAAQTLDGILRVYAKQQPTADMKATLTLLGSASYSGSGSSGTTVSSYVLPAATTTTLGGVKIGDGLSVTSDGVLSVDADSLTESLAADDEETAEALDEIYAESGE